ncbi:MAG: Bifunctional deaminase-reductase domain protein [Frankiales bacterium]|nr:Bifunctional deaminase-reductase domain protein [Frankiales bacterium]
MRDVVLYTLLSLDGVAEEPGDWMFDIDEDVFENLRSTIDTQDDVLLGRGTFDYWSGYWPGSDVQPFADFINRAPKHVFTSHPLTVSWTNTVLADEPLRPYLERLRRTDGADIGVHGSIRLAQDLLAADLVDRLELVVAPTIAGAGRRLFADGRTHPRRLHLSSLTRSSSGCAFLSYRRLP